MNIIPIYRFKFTDEFMTELHVFSKVHQYDERNDFKEAWKLWVEDNIETVNNEIRRLHQLGYDGDILDKMFKSARYYFRKKSNEQKEPVKRRNYISVSQDLLVTMDKHIQENIGNKDYKPKTGFIQYCKANEALLKQVIAEIMGSENIDAKQIIDKIKKTYKNRYFTAVNNKAIIV
jgi:hypothetical protein